MPASPLGAPLEPPELVELGNEPLLLPVPLLPKPLLVPPLPPLPLLFPMTPPSSKPLCPFFAPHPALTARTRAHATRAVDSPVNRHMVSASLRKLVQCPYGRFPQSTHLKVVMGPYRDTIESLFFAYCQMSAHLRSRETATGTRSVTRVSSARTNRRKNLPMPELPDVETVRRRLAGLRGRTITTARSNDGYVLRPRSPSAFARSLAGRVVRAIDRRGKWLRVLLDDGGRLFSHLGMTGWWVECEPGSPKQRSERARLDVTRRGRERSFRYVDSRRFGRLIVAKEDIPEWRLLGPDALADGIDVPTLAAALARSRRSIKEVIMDQSVLAGIGNILATEALWHARIDPRSRSDALSRGEAGTLAHALLSEIQRELAVRAAANDDDWQDVLAVYGHEGEPCPRCGATIERIVLGGRATAFCKRCQRRLQ
jgi:formamidopyrimidine-DNA glycosylase